MTEKIVSLLEAMGTDTNQKPLVTSLCQTVQESLIRRLRPGISPEDCENAFVTAAAWMVLVGLRNGNCGENVTSFTAGDVTIHREIGRETADLLKQAERIMAPYVMDSGFFIEGVQG